MVKLACPLRLMGTKQLHHNHHQRQKSALIFYLISSIDSLTHSPVTARADPGPFYPL